jgi:hypothetical protein
MCKRNKISKIDNMKINENLETKVRYIKRNLKNSKIKNIGW